jgi:hypothetical protein
VQAYIPTSPAAQTPAANNYTYDYDYYEDIYRGGVGKSLLRVPFETAFLFQRLNSGDYSQYPSGQQQQQQFRGQSPYKTQPTSPTVTASAPQQEYRAPPSYAPAPASAEPQYPVDSYDYDTYQVSLRRFLWEVQI